MVAHIRISRMWMKFCGSRTGSNTSLTSSCPPVSHALCLIFCDLRWPHSWPPELKALTPLMGEFLDNLGCKNTQGAYDAFRRSLTKRNNKKKTQKKTNTPHHWAYVCLV
jgi:hypothetical protein